MRIALLLLVALTAACTRPSAVADLQHTTLQSDAAAPATASPAQDAPPASADAPARRKPFPVKSTGLPPERVDAPRALPQPSTACRTDADCAVKDVGSCCGAQPACVNKDAPVDPAAVQAECARKGIASTCAFKPVESCSCVAGACTPNLMTTH